MYTYVSSMLGSAKTEKRSLSWRTPKKNRAQLKDWKSNQIQERDGALDLRATSSTQTQDHKAALVKVGGTKHQAAQPVLSILFPAHHLPLHLSHILCTDMPALFPISLGSSFSIKVGRKSFLMVWFGLLPSFDILIVSFMMLVRP